jgi:hypothetical protein
MRSCHLDRDRGNPHPGVLLGCYPGRAMRVLVRFVAGLVYTFYTVTERRLVGCDQNVWC